MTILNKNKVFQRIVVAGLIDAVKSVKLSRDSKNIFPPMIVFNFPHFKLNKKNVFS